MDALIVFAKVPEPGSVKTRLQSVLTPQQAAQLYEAFLADALAQYVALNVWVRLYLRGRVEALVDGLVPPDVSVHAQQGAGLGERMWQAFIETFAAGAERAAVIGTDHPTLPSAFVEHAFTVLREPLSLCIGPSEDGGYYLLGMNDYYPEVFRDMTYSHEAVFRQTLDRAEQTRAAVTVLPPWYDVDTASDLERLRAELAALSADHAPRTRAVLRTL